MGPAITGAAVLFLSVTLVGCSRSGGQVADSDGTAPSQVLEVAGPGSVEAVSAIESATPPGALAHPDPGQIAWPTRQHAAPVSFEPAA